MIYSLNQHYQSICIESDQAEGLLQQWRGAVLVYLKKTVRKGTKFCQFSRQIKKFLNTAPLLKEGIDWLCTK